MSTHTKLNYDTNMKRARKNDHNEPACGLPSLEFECVNHWLTQSLCGEKVVVVMGKGKGGKGAVSAGVRCYCGVDTSPG